MLQGNMKQMDKQFLSRALLVSVDSSKMCEIWDYHDGYNIFSVDLY